MPLYGGKTKKELIDRATTSARYRMQEQSEDSARRAAAEEVLSEHGLVYRVIRRSWVVDFYQFGTWHNIKIGPFTWTRFELVYEVSATYNDLYDAVVQYMREKIVETHGEK